MYNSDDFFKYAVKHRGISSATLHSYTSVTNDYISPTIIEERQMNVAQMDVFSRLMMDRIIFLGVGINDYVANIVQAQLLWMENVDAKKDIQIYMNSPGGSVYAGLGIYDTMQIIAPDVRNHLYRNGSIDGCCVALCRPKRQKNNSSSWSSHDSPASWGYARSGI